MIPPPCPSTAIILSISPLDLCNILWTFLISIFLSIIHTAASFPLKTQIRLMIMLLLRSITFTSLHTWRLRSQWFQVLHLWFPTYFARPIVLLNGSSQNNNIKLTNIFMRACSFHFLCKIWGIERLSYPAPTKVILQYEEHDFVFCLLYLVSQCIVKSTRIVFFTESHRASWGVRVVWWSVRRNVLVIYCWQEVPVFYSDLFVDWR